jgi:hypothetical protein
VDEPPVRPTRRALLVLLVAAAVAAIALIAAWLANAQRDAGDTAPSLAPTPKAVEVAPVEPSRRPERARARGAEPTTEASPEPSPNPPTELAAPEPTHAIRCVVVAAEDGRPIRGVEVLFVSWNAVLDRGSDHGVTGTDGVAVVDVPDRLVWRAVARKTGIHTERREYVPRATDLRFEMKPAIRVEGQVVYADTRVPAAGVAVRAWSQNPKFGVDEEVGSLRTTDGDGRFAIDDVPDDRPCRIYVVRPGFRNVDATVTRSGPGPLVELVLGEGGILEGTVFDAEGRPAAGVLVFQIPPGIDVPSPWVPDPMSVGSRSVQDFIFPPIRSGADGRYEFRGVRLPIAGVPQPRLTAARDAQGREARSEPATFTRHGERMTRDIRFLGAPRLTVRVVSASPVPSGWEIRAQRNGGDPDVTKPLAPGASSVEFGELRPGTYFVTAGSEVSTAFSEWEISRTVALAAGATVDVDLPMDLAGSVEGVLVDDAGAPIPRILVAFTNTDAETATTVRSRVHSGTDGRFVIPRVLPRAGHLEIDGFTAFMDPFSERAGGHRVRYASVTLRDVLPGGPPLRIVLHRPCSVTGRARPVPRRLAIEVTVCKDAGAVSTSAKTDDEGSLSFEPAFAGDGVLLVLQQEEFAPYVVDDRRLPPGGTLDLGDVVFTEGLSFAATLRDEDGKPLANAEVWETDPWFDRSLACDAEGGIRPEHLPDRPLHLLVAATATTADWRLTLDPRRAPAEIVVGRGVEVCGKVVDAAKAPLRHTVRVQFVPATKERGVSTRWTGAPCSPDGSFSVRLQPGRWKGSVFGGTADPVEFEAAADRPTPLELRARPADDR